MGIANIINNSTTTSGGEIVRELVNSSDGAGLHFDGAAGHILREVGSAPAVGLGTKFSLEYVVKADEWKTSGSQHFLVDFGDGGRVIFGTGNFTTGGISGNLGIYSNSAWGDQDFGVKVLDDLKVHHLVVTIDGTSAVLYDNGNQVGTTTIGATDIDSCKDFAIGAAFSGSAHFFNGTIYRCRFYNKALSSAEVQTAYERADVDFADQYGSQTNKISAAVDKNWGTNQADTGNDTNDRATFNGNYVWAINGAITDISVASNVLQFTTASANLGIYYPSILTGGKKYRVTIRTGTITGDSFKVMQYDGSSLNDIGTLVASTTNIFEFTADSTTNGNLLVYGTGSGTLQINAASVENEVVAIGAVSDYDLAFASPTQSLTVQDRSGAADGTCSASGVTQVQPVVQLNSTSARIGTTAATPADGDVLISGNVGIGESSPAKTLHVRGSSRLEATTDPTMQLKRAGNAAGNGSIECLGSDDSVDYSITFAGTMAGAMQFSTATADALTISSTGNIRIGDQTSNIDTKLKLDGANGADNFLSIRQASQIQWHMGQKASDTSLYFRSGNVGSETDHLTISSTGLCTFANGIAFQSATTGSGTGVGYTLENYEYGTFTMGLSGTTATIPSGYSTARYYRIGNLVWVSWYSGGMTLASSSSAAKLTGLPFNVANNKANYSVFSYTHGDAVDGNSRGGFFTKGATEMSFIDDGDTTGATFIDGSSKYIMVTGVYETDDA